MIGQKLASFIVMVLNMLGIGKIQLTTRIKIYILEEAKILNNYLMNLIKNLIFIMGKQS